jgi:glutamate-1-semialdehyde 2,1-aminomutase
LSGHSKWSRRVAKWTPDVSYGLDKYFNSDRAPQDITALRQAGFERLRQYFRQQQGQSLAYGQGLEAGISDVQFTSQYRVPFPFRQHLPEEFRHSASVVTHSDGVRLQDLDGHWRYDLAGSYGVNVFGYDFYKQCMDEGQRRVADLGPVLGPYHPIMQGNVNALRAISGLDEVSFHMSGTEAVMQAVRLARYHTGKTHLVRFCGAYHGWWDGVQPGVGNARAVEDVYTLAEMSAQTLKVLKLRHDIACVLINPLQALHPNGDAPSDASLINSVRKAHYDRAAYAQWLQDLRTVCTQKGIVLISDEVFLGFRLGRRGAQGYFGFQADLVTYGKTLGGGLPVGVLCGKAALMKRFKPDQPVNVSFARGTFNSHPMVMGCMAVFLEKIDTPAIQAIYDQADALWNQRIYALNQRLQAANMPIQLANMHSIVTVLYRKPSRYNWMFQFYLRAEGLELSWVGSGRFIFSLNYRDEDFAEVADRLVKAAEAMQADGWWWQAPHLSNGWIKQQMLKDLLQARFSWLPLGNATLEPARV